MGLFGLFGGSREERDRKRVRDLAKRAQEKYGDPTGRSRALEQLRELGTPDAIAALLQRFTVKTEPGITDLEEKEYTFSIIKSFGDAAIQPVKDFIRREESVAWGLRCLDALLDEEESTTVLLEELEKLAREYTREPDKKVTLLNHVAERSDARIAETAGKFLDDPSDDVRIAALQTLRKQGEASRSQADAVVGCLLEAEAPRVRTAAAEAMAELELPVGDKRDALASRLPSGWSIDGAGKLKRP